MNVDLEDEKLTKVDVEVGLRVRWRNGSDINPIEDCGPWSVAAEAGGTAAAQTDGDRYWCRREPKPERQKTDYAKYKFPGVIIAVADDKLSCTVRWDADSSAFQYGCGKLRRDTDSVPMFDLVCDVAKHMRKNPRWALSLDEESLIEQQLTLFLLLDGDPNGCR
jgi:hypothetical protein